MAVVAHCFMIVHEAPPMHLSEQSPAHARLLDTKKDTWITATGSSRPQMLALLKDMLLPLGYPDSVASDYSQYQIYDTLQDASTSISFNIQTRLEIYLLACIRASDAAATATAATLTWVLQDGSGMLGSMLFTWRISPLLDTDVKTFRFVADLLNDSGALLEMLAPLFPKTASWAVAASASLLRSLCYVAGGSTKAALSQHFATRNNVADLNAKDGSQETLVSLVGMLAGTVVLNIVGRLGQTFAWLVFISFTAMHLYCNYRAVKAVVFLKLNKQRAFILATQFIEKYHHSRNIDEPEVRCLSPLQVSRLECIFWKQRVRLGVPLSTVLGTFKQCVQHERIEKVMDAFRGLNYVLGQDSSGTVLIAFHESIDKDMPKQVLAPLFHAACLYWIAAKDGATKHRFDEDRLWHNMRMARQLAELLFDGFFDSACKMGWHLERQQSKILCDHWTCSWQIIQGNDHKETSANLTSPPSIARRTTRSRTKKQVK